MKRFLLFAIIALSSLSIVAGIVRTKVYVYNGTKQPVDVYVGSNGSDSMSLYDRSQHDIRPGRSAFFQNVRFDTERPNILFFTDYNPAIRCIRAPCFLSHSYTFKYKDGTLSLQNSEGSAVAAIKNYQSGSPLFITLSKENEVKMASLSRLQEIQKREASK